MGVKGKRNRNDRTEPRRAKPNGDTNRSLTDIELALARHFRFQKNIIAFNVMGESATLPLFHECDMLVATPSGYLTEIEIKRTYADFCADLRKAHHHASKVPLKEFRYCIPEGILEKVQKKLEEEKTVPSIIMTYDEELNIREYPVIHCKASPEDAERKEQLRKNGRILLLLEDDLKPVTRIPDPDCGHRPLFLEQMLEIARLGAMRQVSLREKIVRLESDRKRDPDAALQDRVTELETLLREYRHRFKEETDYELDEKETLYG